jgi:hypothetical protein
LVRSMCCSSASEWLKRREPTAVGGFGFIQQSIKGACRCMAPAGLWEREQCGSGFHQLHARTWAQLHAARLWLWHHHIYPLCQRCDRRCSIQVFVVHLHRAAAQVLGVGLCLGQGCRIFGLLSSLLRLLRLCMVPCGMVPYTAGFLVHC